MFTGIITDIGRVTAVEMRGDMRAVLGALAEEPPETRARLREVIARVVVIER